MLPGCFLCVNPKYFKSKLATNKDANPNDTSKESVIDFVIKQILSNQAKIWNSVEIYNVYIEYGGHQHLLSNKNRLINRISDLLYDKVYLFKSPGVATLLMHKQKASNLFQLVNCNDDENDIQVDQIAGKIKKETIKLPKVKEEYPQLDEVSMWQSCSETLLLLLSKFSPSLNKTLFAGLIGNIITTTVTSHPSMLQIVCLWCICFQQRN